METIKETKILIILGYLKGRAKKTISYLETYGRDLAEAKDNLKKEILRNKVSIEKVKKANYQTVETETYEYMGKQIKTTTGNPYEFKNLTWEELDKIFA